MILPLFPSGSVITAPEFKDFLQAQYNALFPPIERKTVLLIDVTGSTSSTYQIVRMGRLTFLAVLIVGNVTSATGTFSLPVKPVLDLTLTVSRMTAQPTSLGVAKVSTAGLVTLPNFAGVTDPILISGIVMEG